jgi:hypothetical protein
LILGKNNFVVAFWVARIQLNLSSFETRLSVLLLFSLSCNFFHLKLAYLAFSYLKTVFVAFFEKFAALFKVQPGSPILK